MALTGNTLAGTAVEYKCRVACKWYYTNGDWCAFTKTPGVTPSISSPQKTATDTSATGNQYSVCIKYTTPSNSGISSIQSLTCKFKIYDRNSTAGTLYASLRTAEPTNDNSDTWAQMRNNAVGSEMTITGITTTAKVHSVTFTSSSLKANTTYYLYLYTKSTDDIYTLQTGSASDFSCSITYTKKSYTISYDANGGSGAPDSQTKIYGESLTLSSTKPTKANGSKTTTANFNITGNANGGYFLTPTTTTLILEATKTIPQTIKYTFSKWKDSGGTEYSAGASYTANSATTMTAQYTSTTTDGTASYSNNAISKLATPTRASSTVASYTVSFDGNGANWFGSSGKINTTRVFTFGGWAKTADATSANANATYTSATTVYAYWTHKDTKGTVNLPTPPTREGYTFVGWATTADAKTADVGTGTYTPSGDITLYAVWSANNSTIHYNNNGTDTLCYVYYNDNGTAVACIVYYNDNGTAVRI